MKTKKNNRSLKGFIVAFCSMTFVPATLAAQDKVEVSLGADIVTRAFSPFPSDRGRGEENYFILFFRKRLLCFVFLGVLGGTLGACACFE